MNDASAFLDDVDDSFDSFVHDTPFTYRRPDSVSLHFDFNVTQSEMRCDAPDELVLGYTRTMMGFLLFKPDPARIGMIGLGGGSLPKHCYAKLPDSFIAVAEINPAVIALRDDFCIPADCERFQVICQDGAEFVRQSHLPFDVLIVDGYGQAGPAPQLCTQRFYDECYRKLAPGGVLAVNLAFPNPAHETSILRIRRSFSNAVVVVESEDPGNRILFAHRGEGRDFLDRQLSARLDRLESHHTVDLHRTLRCIREELATAS